MSREIVFYRTVANKCPVEQFLDALPTKVAQKVTWVLQLVEDLPDICFLGRKQGRADTRVC